MQKLIRTIIRCLCVMLYITLLIAVCPHSVMASTCYSVLKVNNVYLSPDANTPVSVNADIKVDCPFLAAFQNGDTLTLNFPSSVTIPANQISISFTDSQGVFTQDMFTLVSSQNSVAITLNPKGQVGSASFIIHIANLIITEPGDLKVNFNAPIETGFTSGELFLAHVISSSDTDASLFDLQVNSLSIAGFEPDNLSYTIEVPLNTTTIPLVSATPNNSGASIAITPAMSLDGSETARTTIISVHSKDLTATQEYTITFQLAAAKYFVAYSPKVYPSPDSSTPVAINTDILVENSFMEVFNDKSNVLSVVFPDSVFVPDNQVSILDIANDDSQCTVTKDMFNVVTHPHSVNITFSGKNLSGRGGFRIRFGNLIVTETGDLTAQLVAPAGSYFAPGSLTIATVLGNNSGTTSTIRSVNPLSGQSGNIDLMRIIEVVPGVFRPGTQLDIDLPTAFYFVPQSCSNNSLPIIGEWGLNGTCNAAASSLGYCSSNSIWYTASLPNPQLLRITFSEDYIPTKTSFGTIIIGTDSAYVRIATESTNPTSLVSAQISSSNNQDISNENIQIAEFVEKNSDLSDIKIDNLSVSGFDYQKTEYSVSVPSNTVTIPTVTVVPKCTDANISITQASNLDGTINERTATIKVTSSDMKWTHSYKVIFYRSDTPQPPSTSDCFIATAAYGNYLEPHVHVLRQFRDNVLLHYDAGKWFVREYYHFSPPIAAFIAKHNTIRLFTRLILTPVVFAVIYPRFSLAAIFILIAMLFIKTRKKMEIH